MGCSRTCVQYLVAVVGIGDDLELCCSKAAPDGHPNSRQPINPTRFMHKINLLNANSQ